MTCPTRPVLRRLGSVVAIALAFALFGAVDAAAQETDAPAFDLTGEWIFNTMSPNGAGTRDVTFVQDGNTLTGEIASTMAAGVIEGTIEGDKIRFVAEIYMQSGPFEVIYEATYAEGTLIDGTIDFGDYGSGTFTGNRKEEGGQG